MKVFLFKHSLSTRFSTGLFSGTTLLCVLLFLCSCAPSLHPMMSAEEPKNTFPFFDKNLAEELHSIAVPPFQGDQHNWHETAFEVLSSSKGMSVVSSGEISDALKNSRQDLSTLRPEERLAFITELGRTLQTDAVMHGVILNKQGQIEIIIQIISSRDSRLIWWQAVDVNFKEGTLSRSGQQKVLSSLLSPFLALAGKKEPTPPPQPQFKHETEPPQEPEPPSDIYRKTKEPSGTEPPPLIKRSQKSVKKPLKNKSPKQLPDDISPM